MRVSWTLRQQRDGPRPAAVSGLLVLISVAVVVAALPPGAVSQVTPRLRMDAAGSPPPAMFPYGAWTYRWTTVTPGPVDHGAMAYSPDADCFLLVSDLDTGGRPSWIYTPNASTWSGVPSWAGSPGYRSGPSLAYDAAARTFVLFGGYDPSSTAPVRGSNSTWIYDDAAMTWTNVTPTVSPPTRYGAGMAYVPSLGEILLYGGVHEVADPAVPLLVTHYALNDTWLYDAASNRWTNVTGVETPGWGYSPFVWTEPGSAEVFLFDQLQGWTWSFDPGTVAWRQIGGQGGVDVSYAAAAYDNATRSVVFFGGGFSSAQSTTVWYNATANNWTQAFSQVTPDNRSGGMMALDSKTGQLLLYGGASTDQTFSDTWLYQPAPPPALSVSISPDSLGGPAPFVTTFSPLPLGGVWPWTYLWEFSDGSNDTRTIPGHAFYTPGTYTVRLTVTDRVGNTTSATAEVDVGPPVTVPLASPLSVASAASAVWVAAAGAVAAAATFVIRERARRRRA